MAFLRINGLEVDALVDDFSLEDVSVEDYRRSAADSLEGLTFSVKKQISFTTPYMTAADAYALEGWIRGRQHYWDFQRIDTATTRFNLASKDAGISFSNGTSTSSTLFGRYALQSASGNTSRATVSFGSEGDWTVHFYGRAAASGNYVSYGAVSRNGVITAWEGTTSAATIRMAQISVASGYLGLALAGTDSAGVSATTNFCGVTIARYAFTTTMFLSLASAYLGGSSTGYARPPFVTVSGDCLQSHAKTWNGAGEKGPMTCKGFVEQSEVYPVIINGALNASARKMTFRLTEK